MDYGERRAHEVKENAMTASGAYVASRFLGDLGLGDPEDRDDYFRSLVNIFSSSTGEERVMEFQNWTDAVIEDLEAARGDSAGTGYDEDGAGDTPSGGPGDTGEAGDEDRGGEVYPDALGIQTTPHEPAAGHLFRSGTLPDEYLDFTRNEEYMQHDVHMDEEFAEELMDNGWLEAYIVPEGRNNYRTYFEGGDDYKESEKGELWFNPDAAETHMRIEEDNISNLLEEAGGGMVKLSGFPQRHVDAEENYAVVIEAGHEDLDEPVQVWDEVRVGDYKEEALKQVHSRFQDKEHYDNNEVGFLRERDFVSENFAEMTDSIIGPERGPLRAALDTLDWFTGERNEYRDKDDEKISLIDAFAGRRYKNYDNAGEDESFRKDLLSDFVGAGFAHALLKRYAS